MDIMVYVFIFLFGLVFGSFYNVIIYRIPIDKSIVKGFSMCPQCGSRLKPIDLIPLLSWVLLKAKCRYCHDKISLRYPIIELITGLLFLFSFHQFGLGLEALLYCALWSMLIVTTMIDYDHMVIADSILAVFSIVGLLLIIILKLPLLDHVFGALAGFAIYLAIYFIAKLIYKKEAFGFGDVLLMCSIGLFLGLKSALLTSILSFYICIIFIIILKVINKKTDTKKEIPFGPSICVTAFIVSLYSDKIIETYVNLFL